LRELRQLSVCTGLRRIARGGDRRGRYRLDRLIERYGIGAWPPASQAYGFLQAPQLGVTRRPAGRTVKEDNCSTFEAEHQVDL
jgi:hypothetical protein